MGTLIIISRIDNLKFEKFSQTCGFLTSRQLQME